MPENATNTGIDKNLLILHFTVFIWGFTSILGKLITIGAVQLVWYRVVIAAVSLFLYFKFNKNTIRVDRNTLFTAIFEPLINKTRISKLEIIAGIFIVVGILLIFKFETQYTEGIILGLLSAMCASLFSIINARQVKKIEAPVIAFYELSGAFVWITAYLFFTHGFGQGMVLQNSDIGYLLILGTICTSLAYVAGVSVMREFSAFKVALITNLEPVYGIILAFILFGELRKLSPGFWLGAIVILSTIFLYPVAQTQITKRKAR